MIRTSDPHQSIRFYCDLLGLTLVRKRDYPDARFSLYFLSAGNGQAEIELTHNWDPRSYSSGDQFGHVAFVVTDIFATCDALMRGGVTILRPPRDGKMAFVKDPNGISIELLQEGASLPAAEPWKSMSNTGSW